MTDRELIRTAARLLDIDDFAVWLSRHVQQLGRTAGAHQLGITEEAWRYRLSRAERLIENHLARKEDAA